MGLEELIEVGRGNKPADLLLKGGNLVDVFSGEIIPADLAVHKGIIVGFGRYKAKKEINLRGSTLLPGLMDAHIHLESSMLSVSEFVRAVLPCGTTSVIIDPHEIANVLGLDGIRYLLESSKYQPLNIFMMLPSCVPATLLETAGARLSAYDLEPFLNHQWVLGLGEMMNYPGVLQKESRVLEKLTLLGTKNVDGHAPGLKGKDLSAYVLAGIRSDHECTTPEEAREKLRCGMHIMIREGSLTRNLDALLPLVNRKNARHFSFCTDDRYPRDLLEQGHINFMVHRAIQKKLDPVTAIRMATYNTACYFGLRNLGALAPGYWADIVVVDELEKFRVIKVFKKGVLVAEEGRSLLPPVSKKSFPIRSSVNVHWLTLKDFRIKGITTRARVIEVLPGQLISRQLIRNVRMNKGFVESDLQRDLLKLIVVERHRASGNVGKGLVRGFGLKQGALASSVAHDSHNIICVGCDDQSMLTAVVEIVKTGGGLVVAKGEQVLEKLPLPIAGLMSSRPLNWVNTKLEQVLQTAHSLGSELPNPFMVLSFLSLAVIGDLKLTDKGLVNVEKGRIVSLFV